MLGKNYEITCLTRNTNIKAEEELEQLKKLGKDVKGGS